MFNLWFRRIMQFVSDTCQKKPIILIGSVALGKRWSDFFLNIFDKGESITGVKNSTW